MHLGIMLAQIPLVTRKLRIGQRHQDHVAALLHRHVLVVALDMTRRVGEVGTQVVHAVSVRIENALLVLEQRVQVVFQQGKVGVEEERHRRVHDIDRVDVAVGRDLLLEHERV